MPAKPKKSRRMLIALTAAGMVILMIPMCGCCLCADMSRRGGSPTNIAVAPDGTLYVSDPGQGTQLFRPISGSSVWVIDGQENKVRGLIKLRNASSGIAVAPDGKVYVFPAWADDSTVIEVVEKGSWRTSSLIPIPDIDQMPGMFFRGHEAFLSTGGYLQMKVIDADTEQVVQSIPFPSSVKSMIMLGEDKAYVTGFGHIWVLDTNTHVVSGEVANVSKYGYWHAGLASNGEVYVVYSYENDHVWGVLVLDTETDRVIGQISVPSDRIVGMTTVPDGRIYLLHYGDEPECKYYISVIDTKSDRVTKTIPLDSELHGPFSDLYHRMVVAPNGKVYVVHGFRASLYGDHDDEMYVIVIDPTTDQVVRKIPLQLPWLDRLFPY